MRRLLIITLLSATLGCAARPDEPEDTTFKASSPDAYAGQWRSVTPSLEFLGLTVTSKSSEMGVLAARLTFSGVAWEGGGRIDGDSLVANMTMVGASAASAALVARARDAQTLRLQFHADGGAPLDVTFVRQD